MGRKYGGILAMIGFCGYSFCGGKDCLNPFPTNVDNIKEVTIQNAIFENIDITRDVQSNYSKDIPEWDLDTIIDCNFENGTGAGNVEFTLSQLTSIRIKRRKKGDFNWITVQEIPVKNRTDLNSIRRDYFVPSYEEFEYALVPILNGVEGKYIIGSIETEFNGVFISDLNKTYKLNAQVSYSGRTSMQSVGQITPLGRRYPVIIKNGKANYEMGSVSGMLLGKNYETTHEINRKEIVEEINEFVDFLKNGKPKIIRDWNSNIFMVMVTSNPSVTYNNNYGMGIASVSFEWTEQGKYDNEDDLYDNGFIEIELQQ